jgi:hypothetical protein
MLRSSVNGRVSSRDQIKKWQQVIESIQGTTRVCVVKEKNRPGSDVVGTMCGSNENRRAYDEMHHLASHAPHCMPHCCICYHLSRPDTPKCFMSLRNLQRKCRHLYIWYNSNIKGEKICTIIFIRTELKMQRSFAERLKLIYRNEEFQLLHRHQRRNERRCSNR